MIPETINGLITTTIAALGGITTLGLLYAIYTTYKNHQHHKTTIAILKLLKEHHGHTMSPLQKKKV